MGYYNTSNVRELYSHRIWKDSARVLFNLKKHEPFGLPYYACLHAMVKAKRRVMDNKFMKLRMANNKIEFHADFDNKGRDKDKDGYGYSDNVRRTSVTTIENLRMYGHNLAYFEDIANGGMEYNLRLEPDVQSFMQRFDAWISGMGKLKYNSLSDEFISSISDIEIPIKNGLTSIVGTDVTVDIDSHAEYVKIELFMNEDTKCEFDLRYEVDDATKKLTYSSLNYSMRDKLNEFRAINFGSEIAPKLVRICKEEIEKYIEKIEKRNKKDMALISRLDNEEAIFAREATWLYEKYYKESINELIGAQTLGAVTL